MRDSYHASAPAAVNPLGARVRVWSSGAVLLWVVSPFNFALVQLAVDSGLIVDARTH